MYENDIEEIVVTDSEEENVKLEVLPASVLRSGEPSKAPAANVFNSRHLSLSEEEVDEGDDEEVEGDDDDDDDVIFVNTKEDGEAGSPERIEVSEDEIDVIGFDFDDDDDCTSYISEDGSYNVPEEMTASVDPLDLGDPDSVKANRALQERMRRNRIKKMYRELQRVLPSFLNTNANTKITKISILEEANDFINALKFGDAKQDVVVEMLIQHNYNLKRQLKRLERKKKRSLRKLST